MTQLTELPPHWADHLTHKVEPLVLKSINALIASGKASVELHSETFGDTRDVTSTRRLVIDLE